MILAVFALGYIGLAALCAAMDRHHHDAFKRRPARRLSLGLKAFGWLTLALALAAAILAEGWSLGPVLWLGTITAAGFLLALVLAYRPALALRLSAVMALVGIGSALL